MRTISLYVVFEREAQELNIPQILGVLLYNSEFENILIKTTLEHQRSNTGTNRTTPRSGQSEHDCSESRKWSSCELRLVQGRNQSWTRIKIVFWVARFNRSKHISTARARRRRPLRITTKRLRSSLQWHTLIVEFPTISLSRKKALKSFEEAVKHDPEMHSYWSMIGMIYLMKKVLRACMRT